jgi:hypothetical protein
MDVKVAFEHIFPKSPLLQEVVGHFDSRVGSQ